MPASATPTSAPENTAATASVAASNSNATTAKATTAKAASNRLYDVPFLEENGANFAYWKYRVEMVLQVRGLWPLVDGSEKAPDTTSSDYPDWAYRDRDARAQISLTLSDEPLNTVFYARTAQDAWDRLMTRYEGKGEQKVAYLISELFRSTLSDDTPLDPQINTIIRTAHTLSALGQVLDDKLIAIAIIISLPPSYDTLQTILTAAKSVDLTIDNVRSQIALEEQRRNRESDSAGAFAARSKGGATGKAPPMSKEDRLAKRQAKGFCSHCKIPGHKTEDCQRLKAERDIGSATA